MAWRWDFGWGAGGEGTGASEEQKRQNAEFSSLLWSRPLVNGSRAIGKKDLQRAWLEPVCEHMYTQMHP